MNFIKKAGIRIFQFTLYKMCYLMPFKVPKLIEGEDSLLELPNTIKELGLNNVFLCLDPGIKQLGLSDPLISKMDELNLSYTVFTNIEPNPKIKDIEEGVKVYKESASKCIVAFGGGSAMDTAKAIGARIARPKKSIEKLGGLLRVNKKIPPLFAIPTTAGTGSETTIAAVVTNEVTKHKYAINDLHLIPSYAVLDPKLTVGLPKSITSYTGMDALTHAVEGYITRDVPKKHKAMAEEAIKSIMNNMLEVYNNPTNINARREMLYASFKAGVVFTRVGLTYVHPIAHTLGGLYQVPHGLANAVILPECLEYYGAKVHKKLAHLSDICGLSNDSMTLEEKASAFIAKIRELNDKMGITRKFDIKEEDIDTMIKWAQHEANTAYNPPVLLDDKDIRILINKIKK